MDAHRQFSAERSDHWQEARSLIGSYEWMHPDTMLRRAAACDIEPCRNCGMLEQLALLTADLTCGRCE